MKSYIRESIQQVKYHLDAIRINVRRDTVEKESFYIAVGLRKDLKKEISGIYNISEESAKGWKEVIKNLQLKGLKKVLMIISDELQQIEEIRKECLKGSKYQFCIVHKIRNILNKVRAKDKKEVLNDLRKLFRTKDSGYTKQHAYRELKVFINKWKRKYIWIDRKFKKGKIDYYFSGVLQRLCKGE